MAPKRTKMRLTGKGAAKATATKVLQEGDDFVAVAPTPTSVTLPADPQDRRLTLEGVVIDSEDKIDIVAYEDLMPAFANEPPPNLHPNPERPGVRANEKLPKGLRLWDDIRQGHTEKDGAGWIAVRSASQHERKKEKWFNIRICGSWRMAFLLAKLQRAYWDERAAWLRSPANAVAASANPTAANAVESSMAAASMTPPQESVLRGQATTPKKGKSRAQPEDPGAPSARKAPRKAVTTSGGAQGQNQPPTTKPMEDAPLITSAMLVSSVRLQQIMERQREQLEQQEKQQKQQQLQQQQQQ